MKNLSYLNKYFFKYKIQFSLGFLCVLASNFFGLFPAIYIGKAFNFIENSLQGASDYSSTVINKNVGEDVLFGMFVSIIFFVLCGS